jgi:Helix-turn-helix domain
MSESARPVIAGGSSVGGNEVDDGSAELSSILGRNLRRLRTQRGHSLERLARLSGVSRAMLGQIDRQEHAHNQPALESRNGA